MILNLFSKEKNIESELLNRLGAQSFRYTLARFLYAIKPFSVAPEVRDQVKVLRRDGMLMIPNFLPSDVFDAYRRDAMKFVESNPATSSHQHGCTRVSNYRLKDQQDGPYHQLYEYFSTEALRDLMQAAEKRRFCPTEGNMVIEQVSVSAGKEVDPNTVIHSDVFFKSHKAWLYLDDVDMEVGPLAYHPGSQRFTLKRLFSTYKESIGRNQASPRITDDEIESMNLRESPLCCKANTLVIGDIHGFHRRLSGSPGSRRHALHCSYRFNPFVPQILLKILRRRRAPATAQLRNS